MLKQEPLLGYEVRSSIVNVTSTCATIPRPTVGAYSATKGGLLGTSKTDALDYGPDKIRVNIVGLGNTDAPLVHKAMPESHMRDCAAKIPMRRNGRPEEQANAIVWLCSPQSDWISGVNLPVDGGLTLSTSGANLE